MNKNIVIPIIAVAIIVFGGWLVLRGDTSVPDGEPSSERVLPDVSLKDYDGNEVRLSDFAGKPLVINVWATWCPFCVNELPDFAVVQEEFGDSVQILAVDRAESKSVAKKFTDELGLTGKLIFLLDANDRVYAKIGGFSMPETLFVDAQGNIRVHRRGSLSQEEMRQQIEALLDS